MKVNTVMLTEPAGIPEVFKRINISTAHESDELIMFRTDIFNYGISVKPTSPINVQEIKGYIDPDLDYNYSYDTSQSVFSLAYDEVLGITPQIEFNVKDFMYEGTFKTCVVGQVAAGYKNDKIIPEPLAPCTGFTGPPFSAVGLALYFNPKTEFLLKMKGEICTNTIDFSIGPLDYQATMNLAFPSISSTNVSTSSPPTLVTTDPWLVAGSGTLEAFGGGDIYVSNIGCKKTQIFKAGVTTGVYARGGIKATGTTQNLISSFKVNADFGAKAKVFLSAEMFGGDAFTVVGNSLKAKAFWETEDIRLPFLEWDYEWTANCDKNITEITIEPDGTNIYISADCTDCGNSTYYISFNDNTLTESNGDLREFNYNVDYVVTPPSLYEISNLITFQDKESTQCHYTNEFQDPSFGHENCTTFEDPRDGDLYCLTTIGDQTWLRENLRYDAAGGRWYNDEESVFNVFCGRLYTYEEVQAAEANGGICPPGFRLPTSEDFETLVSNSGGNVNAGRTLKYPSPSFWSNSDLPSIGTFNAVAAGVYYPWLDFPLSFNNSFGQQLEFAYFWTSTTETLSNGKVYPKALVISQNNGITAGGLSITSAPGVFGVIENLGISCRCIQE